MASALGAYHAIVLCFLWQSCATLAFQDQYEPLKASTKSLNFRSIFKPPDDFTKSAYDHRKPNVFGDFMNFDNHKERSKPFPTSLSHGDQHTPPQTWDALNKIDTSRNQKQPRDVGTRDHRTEAHSICPTTCKCVYSPDKTVDIVDCSNRGLKAIPTFPRSTREIYLQDNEISSIPCTSFTYLRNLKKLNISRNTNITLFNCSFSSLSKLQCLWLSRCQLTSFPVSVFGSLNDLIELDLSMNTIIGIGPNAFENLNKLTSLDLSNNILTSLDNKSFHGMSSLMYLNMSYCKMSVIPSQLFKSIPTIHTLDLSSNEDFSMDAFEKGSEGLQNSSLTVLNISRNININEPCALIKNTTFKFLRTTKLKVIVVEQCRLVSVDPKAVLDLPRSVEYISVQNNAIMQKSAIATALVLTNLKEARISDQVRYKENEKASIGKTQGSHQNIFEVSRTKMCKDGVCDKMLKGNREEMLGHFDFVNSEVRSPVTKQKFNVDFCDGIIDSQDRPSIRIYIFPAKLERLYASDIKTSYEMPRGRVINNKVLKYLDYSSNSIKCFGGPLYGLPSLQHLDLSKNYCLRMSHLFFSQFPSLLTLLLQQNVLGHSLASDHEGKTFSTLTLLETLDLSNNVIEDLSEKAFESNGNLRVLNLSGNALNEFRPALTSQSKLEMLDLSYNLLGGFSKPTCKQLLKIKENNHNFVVRISGNGRFACDCDNLYFLNFLLDHSEIFENVSSFRCQLREGVKVTYDELPELMPALASQCMAPAIFTVVLAGFLVMTGCLAVFALYQYKRWQWTYLIYMVRGRLHIGSTFITYRPVAHAFVTYDQDNRRLRYLMRHLFLNRLHQMGVTTVLGEIDFGGGPLEPSIAGAVTSTDKTLVFLSKDIFQDFHRQIEFNLAIMHELHLRRPVLVPVLLLSEPPSLEPGEENNRGVRDGRRGNVGRRGNRANQRASRPRRIDNMTRFMDLLDHYPPEISTFLQGQIHRCLIYTGDSEDFWLALRDVLLEN